MAGNQKVLHVEHFPNGPRAQGAEHMFKWLAVMVVALMILAGVRGDWASLVQGAVLLVLIRLMAPQTTTLFWVSIQRWKIRAAAVCTVAAVVVGVMFGR